MRQRGKFTLPQRRSATSSGCGQMCALLPAPPSHTSSPTHTRDSNPVQIAAAQQRAGLSSRALFMRMDVRRRGTVSGGELLRCGRASLGSLTQ